MNNSPQPHGDFCFCSFWFWFLFLRPFLKKKKINIATHISAGLKRQEERASARLERREHPLSSTQMTAGKQGYLGTKTTSDTGSK